MCGLVTRSAPQRPRGFAENADAQALTPGVRRLRPSVQGTDDRGRLPGVFRLHFRSGWNEMHQNRRQWQKQGEDRLFGRCQFHPKWWVECCFLNFFLSTPTFLIQSPLPPPPSYTGLCSLSSCSIYAHRITSEFFDPMFVAQKWEEGNCKNTFLPQGRGKRC